MQYTDTSAILLEGMRSALDAWAGKLDDDTPQHLYWRLRLRMAEHGFAAGDISPADIKKQIPTSIRAEVLCGFEAATEYWDDIRYASLEPVTQLWGTIVNGVRVAAGSDRATEVQKRVFKFPAAAVLAFFRATRERMEVADALYHAFKPMPAPECQALAALLNINVIGRLDVDGMCRLVRLLDNEGPLSAAEQEVLSSLSTTSLVDAAFSGLRGNA